MKHNNEGAKLTELQRKTSKPRFHIEKLEERIAPVCRVGRCNGKGGGGDGGGCHYNPHGKLVGC